MNKFQTKMIWQLAFLMMRLILAQLLLSDIRDGVISSMEDFENKLWDDVDKADES